MSKYRRSIDHKKGVVLRATAEAVGNVVDLLGDVERILPELTAPDAHEKAKMLRESLELGKRALGKAQHEIEGGATAVGGASAAYAAKRFKLHQNRKSSELYAPRADRSVLIDLTNFVTPSKIDTSLGSSSAPQATRPKRGAVDENSRPLKATERKNDLIKPKNGCQ